MNTKIRELMDARGLSDVEMARLCGRHVKTISTIISGSNKAPTQTTKDAIARVLGADVDELFSVKTPDVKPTPIADDPQVSNDQLDQIINRLDFISAGMKRIADAIDRNTVMLARAWNVKEEAR